MRYNINSGQNRWKSIEYYYDRFFKKKPDKSFKNNIFEKHTELISLSYFQASVGMFPERITGELKPMPTKNKYNKTNTILTDGSLVYGNAYRNATQEVVNSKITKYIAGDIYSIEGFDEISVNIWNEFKVFIQDIQNQGIDIEFFLHPYAPTIYDHISNKYQNVLVVEKNIRNFAKNNNIKIYGSFNPSIYDIDETYFYDAMHCKEKGIELLMSRYSM